MKKKEPIYEVGADHLTLEPVIDEHGNIVSVENYEVFSAAGIFQGLVFVPPGTKAQNIVIDVNGAHLGDDFPLISEALEAVGAENIVLVHGRNHLLIKGKLPEKAFTLPNIRKPGIREVAVGAAQVATKPARWMWNKIRPRNPIERLTAQS